MELANLSICLSSSRGGDGVKVVDGGYHNIISLALCVFHYIRDRSNNIIILVGRLYILKQESRSVQILLKDATRFDYTPSQLAAGRSFYCSYNQGSAAVRKPRVSLSENVKFHL